MKQSITSHADLYFFVWVFAMPVTSVLMIPSIQGTTLGYLMCFLSLPVALACAGASRRRYLNFLLVAVGIWTFFFLASQIADTTVAYEPDLTKVVLIDDTDVLTFVLRKSLFTQTIYLAAVVLYAAYVYIFYKPSWQQWLLAAAAIFAVYGIYEVIYFVVMGRPGDFISNRAFGQEFPNAARGSVPEGAATGTSIQRIDVAGMTVQRLKSLTGEPSMYAFSMFPFWVYFNATAKRRLPVWIIGASLVMSTSSTAFVGYVVYLLIRMRKISFHPVKTLAGAFVLFVVAYVAKDYIADLFQQMVIDKLDGTNVSGVERSGLFRASVDMWADGSLANQLFGVGFGYIRSTDLFSTLLVNTGVFGLVLVSLLILYPAFKLDWSAEGMALRQCCATTWVMMMISVPEFSYLAPWTFVAIAYARLRVQKAAARQSSGALTTGGQRSSINDRRLTVRSRL